MLSLFCKWEIKREREVACLGDVSGPESRPGLGIWHLPCNDNPSEVRPRSHQTWGSVRETVSEGHSKWLLAKSRAMQWEFFRWISSRLGGKKRKQRHLREVGQWSRTSQEQEAGDCWLLAPETHRKECSLCAVVRSQLWPQEVLMGETPALPLGLSGLKETQLCL